MPTNHKPGATSDRSAVLEALFTAQWAAIYDPITRERWDAGALLDPQLCDALCQPSQPRPAAMQRCLEEAGIVAHHGYHPADVQPWLAANWSDALRHYLHSNALPKLSYAKASGWLQDFATMRQKIQESPPPEATKSYPDALARVATTRTPSAMPFKEVLEAHPRRGSRRPMDYAALANLLSRVFGVAGHKRLAVTGSHILRTSPSGGSRHPTEAYVVAFDLPGLEPGIYHFQSDRHELELLRNGEFKALYMERIFGLNRRIAFTPKLALVLTSVVERSMHRYRDARSYRVLHFDLGHLLLTCQLVARSQGLPFFSSYSLGEEAVEALLGIDGLRETAMSQMLFG